MDVCGNKGKGIEPVAYRPQPVWRCREQNPWLVLEEETTVATPCELIGSITTFVRPVLKLSNFHLSRIKTWPVGAGQGNSRVFLWAPRSRPVKIKPVASPIFLFYGRRTPCLFDACLFAACLFDAGKTDPGETSSNPSA